MKSAIALFVLASAVLHGQTPTKDAADAQAKQKQLTDAASAGIPLPATITVADNVNVEAVMLTEDVARRVFGGEVSKNYAVIEVNISNRSTEAGLIVQSLFIDLRDWGLAGPMAAGLSAGGGSSTSQQYQAKGSPLEVSSVEYRIVRGEMLDRQPWTKRNGALRVIQVLGTIGTAFAFPFTKDVVTGIGAWNGAVVPGFQTLFPDGMQAQLDRVSDYGFRNNKVIPQQAADILIAFFPIKRFLTPSLRGIFLKNPALFFNPVLMVLDPSTRPLLYPILKSVFDTKEAVDQQFADLLKAYGSVEAVVAADTVQYQADLADVASATSAIAQEQDSTKLPAAQTALLNLKTKAAADKSALARAWLPLTTNKLYNLLGTISLNNVHIVLSGTMTVDVDNIPATITSMTCTNDTQPAAIWGAAGDRTCAIHGSFLTGGTPVIAEATALGLTVGAVTDGSTDAVLNIKLSLKSPIPAKTPLTFQVMKKNKPGNTVESMKFTYTVPDYPPPAPAHQ